MIVEFWLMGTHHGPLGKIPPAGSRRRTRMTAYFSFDADQLPILKQLLGGLDKKNPADLLKLGRAVAGALAMAGREPDPRLTNTTAPDLDD